MDFARRNSVAGSPSMFSVWNQLATGNNDVANPNASVASSLASDWTRNPVISSAKSYANGQNLLFQDSNNNVLGFNLGNDSAVSNDPHSNLQILWYLHRQHHQE